MLFAAVILSLFSVALVNLPTAYLGDAFVAALVLVIYGISISIGKIRPPPQFLFVKVKLPVALRFGRGHFAFSRPFFPRRSVVMFPQD